MVTIEEKIKLFSKVVFDKVQKENQQEIDKFNKEYGSLLEKKKAEAKANADKMYEDGAKKVDKQKSQIISKARVDEKKLVLEQKNKIFDEAIDEITEYSKKYLANENYKSDFLNSLKEAFSDLNVNDDTCLYVTSDDADKMKNEVLNLFPDRKIDFKVNDDIIGGFILEDKTINTRMDMSFVNRIDDAKELIGEKLFALLK